MIYYLISCIVLWPILFGMINAAFYANKGIDSARECAGDAFLMSFISCLFSIAGLIITIGVTGFCESGFRFKIKED